MGGHRSCLGERARPPRPSPENHLTLVSPATPVIAYAGGRPAGRVQSGDPQPTQEKYGSHSDSARRRRRRACRPHARGCKRALTALEEIVLDEISNAEKVKVGNLVQLTVRLKPATKARKGRNPATGEEITISANPPSVVVACAPAGKDEGQRCRPCRRRRSGWRSSSTSPGRRAARFPRGPESPRRLSYRAAGSQRPAAAAAAGAEAAGSRSLPEQRSSPQREQRSSPHRRRPAWPGRLGRRQRRSGCSHRVEQRQAFAHRRDDGRLRRGCRWAFRRGRLLRRWRDLS